jgi:hypothetical protein
MFQQNPMDSGLEDAINDIYLALKLPGKNLSPMGKLPLKHSDMLVKI